MAPYCARALLRTMDHAHRDLRLCEAAGVLPRLSCLYWTRHTEARGPASRQPRGLVPRVGKSRTVPRHARRGRRDHACALRDREDEGPVFGGTHSRLARPNLPRRPLLPLDGQRRFALPASLDARRLVRQRCRARPASGHDGTGARPPGGHSAHASAASVARERAGEAAERAPLAQRRACVPTRSAPTRRRPAAPCSWTTSFPIASLSAS